MESFERWLIRLDAVLLFLATLATLALIERHGPARVSDLAEVARVDTSVVSRLAKSLEQSGLVERHSDPVDGRAHRLEIAAAGREALEAGRREMAEHMADRLDGWTDEELHELNGSLQTLAYAALGRRGPDVRENR